MISAQIILDSKARNGRRLTTFLLEYPRFIHAEFMTHRVFSRNASSSRAIPVAKQIERIKNNPAMPIFWGKNQAGMQAYEEVGSTSKDLCKALWLQQRDRAVEAAEAMMQLGLHKQLANRIIEPWMHIAVLCTATEDGYGNFFNLRYHKAAQPEIRFLSENMLDVYEESEPASVSEDEWHLPFITAGDRAAVLQCVAQLASDGKPHDPWLLQKISAARCARLSYYNFDGNRPPIDEDLELFGKLMGGNPKHASPAEHQATPYAFADIRSGNFLGWHQFRKGLEGENLTEFTRRTKDW